jgi:hypothetical protein
LLRFGKRRQNLSLRFHVGNDNLLDRVEASLREADDHFPAVATRRSLDKTALLETIDAIGDGPGAIVYAATLSASSRREAAGMST